MSRASSLRAQVKRQKDQCFLSLITAHGKINVRAIIAIEHAGDPYYLQDNHTSSANANFSKTCLDIDLISE